MDIEYSDGGKEELEVLKSLQDCENLSSLYAIGHRGYDTWATRYHLCPERGNLLRHLNFSGLEVLELGAGMGAVSRVIAENSKSLHCVEGTERRYTALRARLRDLNNVTGEISNVSDIKIEKKFDVVCVIGVLEYSDLFLKRNAGEDPFQKFIEIANHQLKPDGALVLAIENRLGMKYWNGAAEDHTSALFDGICGYAPTNTPRTFSHRELCELLRNSGFSELTSYFPFPDYKIPSTILSEDFVKKYPIIAAEMACHRPFENYGQPRWSLYPELLGSLSLAKAGLLEEFANSFLLVASKETASTAKSLLKYHQQGELAWHYSLRRKDPIVTALKEKGSVKRSLLTGAEKTSDPLRPAESFKVELFRNAYYGRYQECFRAIDEFIDWSLRSLRNESLDANILNAYRSKDGFEFIDLEWKTPRPISPTWFILRTVLSLYHARIHTTGFPGIPLRDYYSSLLRKRNLEDQFEKNLEQEVEFQCGINPYTSSEIEEGQLRTALSEIPTMIYPRRPQDSLIGQSEIEHLRRENARMKALLGSTAVQAWNRLRRSLQTFPRFHRLAKRSAGLFLPTFRESQS